MSRVAKNPVEIPSGVQINLSAGHIEVKGGKGTLKMDIHNAVEIIQEGSTIVFAARDGAKQSKAIAGTMRALIANMVTGVSEGFERKLSLVGVGYRAQAKGDTLSLSLGYSHPVEYKVPAGVTIETPTQTEVVVKGVDKQQVGQVAAEIRGYRAPEPYKGKGVRYSGEAVRRKEAKKK